MRILVKYSLSALKTLSKLRTIHSVRNFGIQATSDRKFEEIEIKVPWGKICGKYWGPRDVQPIIAMHGARDNAGSYDPLATRLPENISFFVPDLPGHGLSSWIPPGMQYTGIFYAQIIDRIREHFKIDKLKLLSHSMSGFISFLYISMYPNDIKYVITFDNYKPLTFKASITLAQTVRYREAFFKNEKSLLPRISYTNETAKKKMIEISKNSLDEASSYILMKRGVTRQPDGLLCFNEDPRVKCFTLDMTASVDYMKTLAQQIHCPYMFINGDHFDRIDVMERYYEVLKVIEKNSEDFQHHSVPGTHHFHMSNPEQVANIINPFILKYAD